MLATDCCTPGWLKFVTDGRGGGTGVCCVEGAVESAGAAVGGVEFDVETASVVSLSPKTTILESEMLNYIKPVNRIDM